MVPENTLQRTAYGPKADKVKENHTMESLITSTTHQILLG